MEILKYAILFVTIFAFVLSSLVIREDLKEGRNTVWATFLLCLSMALLCTVDWF